MAFGAASPARVHDVTPKLHLSACSLFVFVSLGIAAVITFIVRYVSMWNPGCLPCVVTYHVPLFVGGNSICIILRTFVSTSSFSTTPLILDRLEIPPREIPTRETREIPTRKILLSIPTEKMLPMNNLAPCIFVSLYECSFAHFSTLVRTLLLVSFDHFCFCMRHWGSALFDFASAAFSSCTRTRTSCRNTWRFGRIFCSNLVCILLCGLQHHFVLDAFAIWGLLGNFFFPLAMMNLSWVMPVIDDLVHFDRFGAHHVGMITGICSFGIYLATLRHWYLLAAPF